MNTHYTKRLYLLAILLLLSPWTMAQDNPDAATVDADAPEAESVADPVEAARRKGGDLLVMKSGAVMSGVQILKSTPTTFEIEVVKGMKPLVIPRRQVESVEYDDLDPARDARHADSRPKPQDDLMTDGKELSPELVDKLVKPIPGTPMTYDKDYMQVFKEIGETCGVQIVIDPSLQRQPQQNRLWKIEVPEGTRLMDLLQRYWLKSFPAGKITYEFEMVILHKKDVNPTPVAKPDETANPAATLPPGITLGGNE